MLLGFSERSIVIGHKILKFIGKLFRLYKPVGLKVQLD